jgi:hypothetical protein
MKNAILSTIWQVLLRFPIIGLTACLGLIIFTGGKLYKMAQIEGWAPGASISQVEVLDKGTESGRRGSEYYWVELDPIKLSDHRIRLEQNYWNTIKIGDSIEVRQVPSDDSTYSKNDIFTEPGNYSVDVVLLIVELAGVVFFALNLFKRPALVAT